MDIELDRTTYRTVIADAFTDSSKQTRLDMTGYTVWFTAKSSPSLEDADGEFFKDNAAVGGVALSTQGGTPNSRATATINPADYASLPNEFLHLDWDFKAKAPDGKVHLLDSGAAIVKPTPTKTI